jgi:two-component system KDP operon response regulator KdpE
MTLGAMVLVVEHDATLRAAISRALGDHGFRAVEAGAERLERLIARLSPAAIVLDLDRDGGSPWVLTRVHDATSAPVIVLSSRAGEGDKIAALDAGADDYMTKPFGTSELMARLRVALRRARGRAEHEVVEISAIRIDHARYEVTVDGRAVHLTPIEFRLLAALAREAGRVVAGEDLLREVWGVGTDRAHYLRVHIAALRQKIEDDPAHPQRILTVTRIGYRLVDRRAAGGDP